MNGHDDDDDGSRPWWWGVYLCEHRDVGGFGGGHARDVVVTLPAVGGAVRAELVFFCPVA